MPPAGLSSKVLGPEVSGPPMGPTFWVIPGIGETGNPITSWADQSGNGRDQTNVTVGRQPVPGTGINGKASVDFTAAHPDFLNNSDIAQPLSNYYSATNFSIIIVWKYTGAHNYNNNAICPMVLGVTNNANPLLGAGFMVGLNPGDPTAIQCSGWFNDGAVIQSAHATGPAGSAALAHYTIVTFGGGVLSTYLDAQAVVTAGGLGPATQLTPGMQLGIAQTSTNQDFDGSMGVILTYNRTFSAGEVSQAIKYAKKTGGFP